MAIRDSDDIVHEAVLVTRPGNTWLRPLCFLILELSDLVEATRRNTFDLKWAFDDAVAAPVDCLACLAVPEKP